MDKGVYDATLRSTHYWMYNVYIPLVTGSVRNTTSNMDMHEFLGTVSGMKGSVPEKAVRVIIQFRKTYFDIH